MPSDLTSKPWPAMSIAQAHALLTQPGSPFEMEERLIRGVTIRTWKNVPPTLREVVQAGRLHGDKIFLVYENDRVSFEAFTRATLTLAHQLIADGVNKGDRVALIMRNLPEWPVAFFAAAIIGAIVTPLNAWWTGPELEYGLTDSGAKIAIVDAERLERLSEHLHNCPALERIYVARENEEVAHPLVVKLETVIGPANGWKDLPDRPFPDVAIEPEDDATIFYTSGTTGKPKGALGTHRNFVCNIGAAGISAARSFLRRGEPVPAPDPTAPQRGTLLSVPFFHATGCDRDIEPIDRGRRQAGADAQMGHRSGHGADRAREGDVSRRRAHHRLAADRASGAGEIRSLLARERRLWRRALGAGAGAQDQGDLPEIGRPAMAGA